MLKITRTPGEPPTWWLLDDGGMAIASIVRTKDDRFKLVSTGREIFGSTRLEVAQKLFPRREIQDSEE